MRVKNQGLLSGRIHWNNLRQSSPDTNLFGTFEEHERHSNVDRLADIINNNIPTLLEPPNPLAVTGARTNFAEPNPFGAIGERARSNSLEHNPFGAVPPNSPEPMMRAHERLDLALRTTEGLRDMRPEPPSTLPLSQLLRIQAISDALAARSVPCRKILNTERFLPDAVGKKEVNKADQKDDEGEELPPTFRWVHLEIE